MKKLFLFCLLVSFYGFVLAQNIIIGNAENCPFSILGIEKATLASGEKNSEHHGKAYSIEILPAAELESITVAAIIVDKDGTVKGMDSRDFKGDFNQHRTYKIIINEPEIKIEETDTIYFIPYLAETKDFAWIADPNKILGFINGSDLLSGIVVAESPGGSGGCTNEEFAFRCNKCEIAATNLCGSGKVTSFECGCTVCKFSCTGFGGGGGGTK